jgi:hypothetical protein
MAGAPFIIWDNIPRGERITCPHIERSCTTAYYEDRKLGVSEIVMTSAATIHFFTGNNIEARGDLSSRAISIRVKTDRPDPEDREFKHSDPIAWTTANRGAILKALYTILLGNPALKTTRDAPAKTRFKVWYRLVGSAVEHAAVVAARGLAEAARAERAVDFQKLLRKKGDDDEDDSALAEMLAGLGYWARGRTVNSAAAINAREAAKRDGMPDPTPTEKFWFKAADLRDLLNKHEWDDDTPLREACRAHLYPDMSQSENVDARSLNSRLKHHVDEPVPNGDGTLILRTGPQPKAGTGHPTAVFWVAEIKRERTGEEVKGSE